MGYFNSVFTLLFILIGLPSNAMVMGIIFKKKLYSQPSLMLMLSLAVANLFILLCNTPLTVNFMTGHQYTVIEGIAAVCKTAIFTTLFALVSTHTIAMISVDRVIYLTKPLTYHLIVTPWRMFVAIAVMWIFSIALVLPIMPFKTLTPYSVSLYSCTGLLSNIWAIKLVEADVAVATLVQFVGYGCVIFITRTRLGLKFHQPLSNSFLMNGKTPTESAALKDYSKIHLRLTFVFGDIFVTSLLSLVPLLATFAVSSILSYNPPSYVYATIYTIYLSKSAINPILGVSLLHTALCKQYTTGVQKL